MSTIECKLGFRIYLLFTVLRGARVPTIKLRQDDSMWWVGEGCLVGAGFTKALQEQRKEKGVTVGGAGRDSICHLLIYLSTAMYMCVSFKNTFRYLLFVWFSH